MPQFYETDNLTCWVSTLIEEHYEMFCADKEMDNANDFRKEVMRSSSIMKEWVENYLLETEMIKKGASFTDAIINSVDWKEVYETATQYFDDVDENK